MVEHTDKIPVPRCLGIQNSSCSPHPAVGFAVVGVDADGSLAVPHRSRVIPEFAVGSSSGKKGGGKKMGSREC